MDNNKIPNSFMAGTSISFNRSLDNYPASLYSSNIYLTNKGNNYTIAGSSIDAYSFNYYLVASGTSSFVAGDYQYTITAFDGTDTFVAEQGNISITPNIITSSGTDTRTDNKIKLDNINAVIDGRITDDVENYTIGGRSLTKIPIKDLIDLKSIYEARVNEELRIERKQSKNLTYRYKDLYEPAILNKKRIL